MYQFGKRKSGAMIRAAGQAAGVAQRRMLTRALPSSVYGSQYHPMPRVPAGAGEYEMGPTPWAPILQGGPTQYGTVAQVNQLAAMQNDINQLQMQHATQGGPVYAGMYEQGLPIYAHPEDVSKGGILQSSTGSLAIGAVAGTTATVAVEGQYLARLTNTLWAFCAVTLSGDLSDPEESGKCVVDAAINGARVNTLFQTPLDVFAPNLFGTIFAVPVGRQVPPDADVEFTVEVLTTLTTGDIGNFTFRLYAGNESKWMHALSGSGR